MDSPVDQLRRSRFAPPPRTLVEILTETAARHPDATALDNGVETLTYSALLEAGDQVAEALAEVGVAAGDRVGIRLPSGTTDLYVAIVGTLLAGCAYVPVDHDDPDERARVVFGEADVAAVISADLVVTTRRPDRPPAIVRAPRIDQDAWIIFTSGSTGAPKGVAVSHRSAAAFVDAEARIFLQQAPLGPGDRVMAGLSVAFDASCEEMWLAWRHGAALVPAPRSLVRSGVDLAPWLIANEITIVSTVPTLLLLWPPAALAKVRMIILGGEACPPEIGARYADEHREVWNTYGPTEATVVACAARVGAQPPVRIGLPLDGWDLAVVGTDGQPVEPGGSGQLIIGGVGLARYLDPVKDAQVYAPMPALGWERAYRSGDIVRFDGVGLLFGGRADDQVKVGGRRIELGEIDSALLALPGVIGAAAAVRRSASGNSLLVGYLTVDGAFDQSASLATLRRDLPAALVPRLAVVDTLPTRTSGKIDRDALPWPLPADADAGGARGAGSAGPPGFTDTEAWLAQQWADILGGPPSSTGEDFFDLGGGSLTAAQLVSRLRERHPDFTVADIYEAPTLGGLAAAVDEAASAGTPLSRRNETVGRVPRATQWIQVLASVGLRSLSALRWLTWIAAANALAASLLGLTWLPQAGWWWIAAGWLLLITPLGRMGLSALAARALLSGVRPGDYLRGGRIHLRIWLAERVADELGATGLAGAPLMTMYARWLGARIGRDVDLHSLPPITGDLTLGDACSIEPEVDLRGHWIDGERLHVGSIGVGHDARIGARSTLVPGARVGDGAEVAPGSAVLGDIPAGQAWSGAPATAVGAARGPWESERPPNRPVWRLAYLAGAIGISLLPILSLLVAIAAVSPALRPAETLGGLALRALAVSVPAALIGYLTLAALVLVTVRVASIGLTTGHHPVHGPRAWQAWLIERVLDEARTWLFPIYSSAFTPVWLRLLGARIGRDVEASTVLMLPKFVAVGDGAFLADDTLVGGYELGGGWLRIEQVKIGKHAFVGNSGMAAPGRKVPKHSLVAVLSAAPQRGAAKRGTSWLGSPPQRLRRDPEQTDDARTYRPALRLRVARCAIEALRAVPVWLHLVLTGVVVVGIESLLGVGPLAAVLLSGVGLLVAGAVAAGVTTAAKWMLVGRLEPGEHPLWSLFVWSNELADTFVEVLAAPWFARAAVGTPVLNLWLSSMGATVGRGVWCETYWLPEADLVRLDEGATVGAGCVVQTHLFHDRVLRLDRVTLRRGATLGPNSVVLPAAEIGRHATVGPVSLVMRGESVPDLTRWIGNPIGPWISE